MTGTRVPASGSGRNAPEPAAASPWLTEQYLWSMDLTEWTLGLLEVSPGILNAFYLMKGKHWILLVHVQGVENPTTLATPPPGENDTSMACRCSGRAGRRTGAPN